MSLRRLAKSALRALVLPALYLGFAPRRYLFGRPREVRRSLWAGTPILNLTINARAERRLGVEADSLAYTTYFITDAFTYNLSRFMRWPVLRAVLPFLVLAWAARRYQRFHFYCDRGLLPPEGSFGFQVAELRFLRWLGAEVYLWTYGADVRTRGRTSTLGEHHCCIECPAVGRACICDDEAGAGNQTRISRHVNAIFAMGDMIEYTPTAITDLFFWPVDLEAQGGEKYRPVYPPIDTDAPVRVVHAPNHRHFKGTRFVEVAVERLRAEGVAIELVLVEGVPNDQALEIYRAADIVFDQCLIGFHGYFANEAMALGKPVVCFIRDPERYLLAPEECPIVNTTAHELESTLRTLAADRTRLQELGERGRRYIERHHTLEAFGSRLALAYERTRNPN